MREVYHRKGRHSGEKMSNEIHLQAKNVSNIQVLNSSSSTKPSIKGEQSPFLHAVHRFTFKVWEKCVCSLVFALGQKHISVGYSVTRSFPGCTHTWRL
jgi:phosphatidylethanolamine-binding protein (PEBP) family uncharacterized protein